MYNKVPRLATIIPHSKAQDTEEWCFQTAVSAYILRVTQLAVTYKMKAFLR